MDQSMQNGQMTASLLFYDAKAAKRIHMQEWTAYEKQFRIFEIYPAESCIFSLAVLQRECFLACLDLKDNSWQRCRIPIERVSIDLSAPSIRIQYDGMTAYVGIQDAKTGFWQYFRILRTLTELSLEPISFLRGDLTAFRPIRFCEGELVFEASGFVLAVREGNCRTFRKVNAYKAIIRYSDTGFDVIASGPDDHSLEYDAWNGSCIYYETIENAKNTLIKYDLTQNTGFAVPVKETQFIAPSETDLYLYSDTEIQRMSDGKVITIDAIMQAFQSLRNPAFTEIEPFPSMFFFYDHWLETELEDSRFFVIHLDTMQPYYFDSSIDIKGNCIYLYK